MNTEGSEGKQLTRAGRGSRRAAARWRPGTLVTDDTQARVSRCTCSYNKAPQTEGEGELYQHLPCESLAYIGHYE